MNATQVIEEFAKTNKYTRYLGNGVFVCAWEGFENTYIIGDSGVLIRINYPCLRFSRWENLKPWACS